MALLNVDLHQLVSRRNDQDHLTDRNAAMPSKINIETLDALSSSDHFNVNA